MRLVDLESTNQFVDIGGGIYCRIWIGKDEKGQRVTLMVRQLYLEKGADTTDARRGAPYGADLEQATVCTKQDIESARPKHEPKKGH